MKDMPPSHKKIRAFCTVDPSYLEREGDQIFCRKCSREMANLDLEDGDSQPTGGRARRLLCGVISAAALSSCTTGKMAPDDGVPLLDRNPHKDEVPLPGIKVYQGEGAVYGSFRSDYDGASTDTYPKAIHIEGKPGFVESPYGGHPVDVSRIPPGSLVIDPKFGAESGKIFRI
jgi:hypothetical protein